MTCPRPAPRSLAAAVVAASVVMLEYCTPATLLLLLGAAALHSSDTLHRKKKHRLIYSEQFKHSFSFKLSRVHQTMLNKMVNGLHIF